MRSVTAKDGQTLFDIAVQELGKVDYAFDLADLNGLSPTDDLQNGQDILLIDVAFEDKTTVDYFADAYFPASGDQPQDNILGGIGYMQIGTNFKVS